MRQPTRLERRIDVAAHRFLADAPAEGARARLVEVGVFVLKQAWACLFGASLLVVIVAVRLWYPDDASLAPNDFLTLAAIAIQVIMVATRLETGRELWVIVLFHVTGTAMELFKTDMGSWMYAADGVLRIGGVPAVQRIHVRRRRLVHGARLPALRPRLHPLSATLAHRDRRRGDLRELLHPPLDLGPALGAGRSPSSLLWARTTMYVRVWRKVIRMPLLAAFGGVAVFIYLAENIATWAGAWAYPDQLDGWHPVSITKLVSWFLLMIISVVLVAWVYPPQPPAGLAAERAAEAASSGAAEAVAGSGDSANSGRSEAESS